MSCGEHGVMFGSDKERKRKSEIERFQVPWFPNWLSERDEGG